MKSFIRSMCRVAFCRLREPDCGREKTKLRREKRGHRAPQLRREKLERRAQQSRRRPAMT